MPTLGSSRHQRVEQRSNILQLWCEGYELSWIASQCGVSPHTAEYAVRIGKTPRSVTARQQAIARRTQAECTAQQARIVQLMTAGASFGEIISELQLSKARYKTLLAGIDPAIIRHWRRRRSREDTPAVEYRYDDCVAALREAAQINEGTISTSVYRQLRASHPAWPPLYWIVNQGWNKVKADAGLPVTPRPVGMGLPRFSDSDMRQALQRVGHIYGYRFSVQEYESRRLDSEPTAATIRMRRGNRSWTKALAALVPELKE